MLNEKRKDEILDLMARIPEDLPEWDYKRVILFKFAWDRVHTLMKRREPKEAMVEEAVKFLSGFYD